MGLNILLLVKEFDIIEAQIIGGKPGLAIGTITLNDVIVHPPLLKCVVETGGIANPTPGTIETAPIKAEIVEGENGEVLVLFVPKEGTSFGEIKFLDKGAEECAANGVSAALTGSFLGLALPQRTEVLRQAWVFEAAEHNFFLASGALDTASLKFGTEALTLTGLSLVLLTSDAAFGPF